MKHKFMKKILLSKGKIALVDDDDFEKLKAFKWFYNSHGYAIRSKFIGVKEGKQKQTIISMHRMIMGTPDGMDTDHINHDKLDNRKENLRICTTSENSCNKHQNVGVSGFRGVRKHYKKWQAQIWSNGKFYSIGTYKTSKDAAIAWNEAARKYHGKFAMLNVIS